MVMKKHIVHNFYFYIYEKINIQKYHKIKKKLNIKLIFFYIREMRKLPFLS